ncbi:serpin B11-like [Leptodactylus fuscus]|uniref:serpin B11-like n=1 Tax=Leptodactylus fuscus TaxID=238119 RepID=UPI003F4EF43B
MDTHSKALTMFSFNLMKEITKTEKHKNIMCSPVSIYVALKMVMTGAGGKTKSEMEEDTEGLLSAIKALVNQTDKKYELTIANALFGDKGFNIQETYVQKLKSAFCAEIQAVDFKHRAEEERKKINDWVKCKTNGKITELFATGSLNESSVMVLANALYFKGQWQEKFDEKNTEVGTFYVNQNEKKTCLMMTRSGKYKCATLPEMKSKVVVMPYQNEMCLAILLPDDITGINEVLSMAKPELLINWVHSPSLMEKDVHLKMPKFKMEATYNLVPMLIEMGMNDVFQANADLSGISPTKGICLSTVTHKTYIEVNEEGTAAAAATGAGIVVTSMPVWEQITVDHPFMFCILDKTKSLILFQGLVCSV